MKTLSIKLQFFLSVFMTLLAIGGFGYYYLTRLDTLFNAEVQNAMMERSKQTAENLNQALQARISLISTLAQLATLQNPDIPLQTKLDILAPMVERHNLIRFGISNLEGKSLTTDGYNINVSEREYFLLAREGRETISRLLSCHILNIPIVVYATPLYTAKGKIYAILYATEDTQVFSRILASTPLYDSASSAFIINSDGQILDGSDSTLSSNIFTQLAKENPPIKVAAFKDAFSANQSPVERFTLFGAQNYVVTAPIRTTQGWSLVTTSSEEVVMAKTHAVLNLTVYTLLLTGGCVLLVILYVMQLQRKYARQKGMATVAIESAGLYYIIVDANGIICYTNQYFTARTGFEEKALKGTTLHSLSSGISSDELQMLLNQESPFELTIITSSTETLYVQLTPLPDATSEAFTLLGTDITQQKLADQQQRSNMEQRNLQMIFDNVSVPLGLRSLTDQVIMINSALAMLASNPDPNDIIGKNFPEILPYENYSLLHNALEEAFATSSPITVDNSLLYPDHSRRYFRTTQVPLYDERGMPSSVLTVFIDVTDSKTMQEHLVKEVNRLQNILETSPIGVLISVNGTVRFLNLCAQTSMTRIRPGDSIRELFADGGQYERIIKEIKEKGLASHIEVHLGDLHGNPHDLLISAAPTEYEGEKGLIAWGMDVTYLKNIEKELMAARDTAEAATCAKSEFLANMSHEIRTPMNAIIGMNHLVLQTELNAKQKDYLDKIDISAKNLLRILNDILDFSKIEANQLDIEYCDFRLDTLLNDIVGMITTRAQEKGLKVHLRIDVNVPVWVQGDSVRLGQILHNLLSNALKFTEKGSIAVLVGLREQQGDDNYIHFTVRDTGIGMSPEQSAVIFDSFTQADASTTRKYGGTGLGLAISKRLVNLMHGNIHVHSAPDQGATFTFFVRLKAGKSLPPPEASAEVDMYSLQGLHLLLVEDNAINQQVALEILQSVGIDVDIAENGEEALAYVRDNHYDIILMDIQMPVMDGITATQRIRSNPQLQNLPIIAMTAHAMTGDKEKTLACGMNDYVTKPIDPCALFETLRRWLANTRPAIVPTPKVFAPASNLRVGEIAGMQKEQALARLMGNENLLSRLLVDFYSNFHDSLDLLLSKLLPDGKARTNVMSTADPEYAEILRLVHTIKGVAGNLAMPSINKAASYMETLLKEATQIPVITENWRKGLHMLEEALVPTLDSIALQASAVLPFDDAYQDPAIKAARLRALSPEQKEEALASLHSTHALLALNDPEAEMVFATARTILTDIFTDEVQNVLVSLDTFEFTAAMKHLDVLINALTIAEE